MANHTELSEQNFPSEVLEAQGPVLVDFWAEWCAPCRAQAPVIDALADEFANRARVAKLNVDDHPELAKRYSIRSIPSLLFFQNGEVVEQISGTTSRRVLADKLEGLLGVN